MTRRTLFLAGIVLCLTIAGGAIAIDRAAAEPRDDIEYDAVYACGSGKSKFKVLSCKGLGKFDRCDVFYINELSPGGGNKVSTYRTSIEADINQGCRLEGRSGGSGKQQRNKTNDDRAAAAPIAKQETSASSCPASDPDSEGKTANEKTFRGVIRRLWEKDAAEGSDGAVTITFDNLIVGGSRPWHPTATDAYSQADPKKPIYAVRAVMFETCTDYKAAVATRKMERIYDCFVHKAGGWQCTQTGASGALALKDKKSYTPKKRRLS